MTQIFELPSDDEPTGTVKQSVPEPEVAAAPAPQQAKRPTVFIGTPAFGCRMDVGFVMSLLRLQTECLKQGIALMFQALGNESLIPRARNILTEQFHRSGCTHLLFLDADISFAPETILRMLKADKDVVASLYPKKYFDYKKLEEWVKQPTQEPLPQVCLDFNINLFQTEAKQGEKTVTTHVQEGNLVRVLDAATGCLLIKREVITKMKDFYKDTLGVANDILGSDITDYVALFDCMIENIGGDKYLYKSEDYAWCRRWQDLGGEVWADVSQPLIHAGFLIQDGDIRQRLRKSVSYAVDE